MKDTDLSSTKSNIEYQSVLAESINSNIVIISKEYALKCHNETNHTYDGKPYSTHLQIVFDYACKFGYLLPSDDLKYALAACWTHDVIEDCRQTYNDVKKSTNETVADITYAVTNEKGKNRKERANDKYYEGIRNTPCATYVKICDRLANAYYSKSNKSRMHESYSKEYKYFSQKLFEEQYQPMFDALEELLGSS